MTVNDRTLRNVIERTEFRDRSRVFRDRTHAGEILAEMLGSFRNKDAMVMAIPAGGVPVAAVIAEKLNLPLEVAVVSKITLPWNTEVGYGAVAFDGTARLNEDLLSQIRLSEREIQQGMDQTYQKVLNRVKKFRGGRAFPNPSKRPPILVDDGLASGFTLLVAVEALRKSGAQHIIVAVPTGHRSALQRTAREVEAVYCANIRSGWNFAVADAYERWWDMDEGEVARIYKQFSHSNRAVSAEESGS